MTETRCALPLVRAGVEELLDQAQLAVAADERRPRGPADFSAPRAPRDDAQRPPERHEPVLPLQLVRARVLVDDRLLGRAPGRLADEHGARLGRRLDARRGVDEVAGDHALALGAERDRRLAGEHAGPGAQLRRADLVAERGHGRDQVERRPHGALGVVLGRDRRAPDRHHRVADELLDRAAVELDQPPAGVEVAGEQLARVLGVALSESGGEADEVGEEDRDEPALGRRCRAPGAARVGGRRRRRRAALAAELSPGSFAMHRRTGRRRASAAPHSEQNFASRPVLGAAARAGHTAAPRHARALRLGRSSQGVASSRSKISRASASSGSPRGRALRDEPLAVLEQRDREPERQPSSRKSASAA